MDCNPPGSSVHGIFQARILGLGALSFSRYRPDPGIEPASAALASRLSTTETPGKPQPDRLLATIRARILISIRVLPPSVPFPLYSTFYDHPYFK